MTAQGDCKVFSILGAAVLMLAGSQSRGANPQGPQSKINAFFPKGYRVEKILRDDLNADKLPDAMVLLIEARGSEGEVLGQTRRLIVLLQRPAGKYVLVGSSNKVFLCNGCAGLMNDPGGSNVEMKVDLGSVLHANNLWGSRIACEDALRFRLDPKTEKMMLVRVARSFFDRASGATKIIISDYVNGTQSIRFTGPHSKPVKDQIGIKVKLVPVPMENVDAENLPGNSDGLD